MTYIDGTILVYTLDNTLEAEILPSGVRNNTAANWTANNPILEIGVKGIETDTGRWKMGTGVAWNSQSYGGKTDVLGVTINSIPYQSDDLTTNAAVLDIITNIIKTQAIIASRFN